MKQTVRICRLVIPYFVNLDFPQQQTQDKTTKVEKQINLERSVRDVTSQPKDDVIKINDVTSQSKVDDIMDTDDVMDIDDGDSSECENDKSEDLVKDETESRQQREGRHAIADLFIRLVWILNGLMMFR